MSDIATGEGLAARETTTSAAVTFTLAVLLSGRPFLLVALEYPLRSSVAVLGTGLLAGTDDGACTPITMEDVASGAREAMLHVIS